MDVTEKMKLKMLKQKEYIRNYYQQRKEAGLIPTKRPVLTEEERLNRFIEKEQRMRERRKAKYRLEKEELQKLREIHGSLN